MRLLKRYLLLLLVALIPNGLSECSKIRNWRKIDPFPTERIFTDLDQVRIDRKARIIDSIFNRLQSKQGFNGTVLYAEKGHVVYERAFGFANFKTKERLTTQSSFQLASVSKMFTAMSVMILKERGKLDYDDAVRKHIREFPYEGITIRHLLNHRSGLPEYMHMTDEVWNQELPFRNDDMVRLIASKSLPAAFPPDKGFDYCNTNYALLACIVERVSGKPFDEFARENIFEPLGMKHTFIYHLDNDSIVPQFVEVGVSGHKARRVPVPELNHYQNGVMGDKGVYSSVHDLYLWDQALYHETLVSGETLQDAFNGGSPRSVRKTKNYGFGWRIRDDRDSTVFHFGWWKGFRSFFIRDMAQEKTIIILTNLNHTVSADEWWKIIDDHRYELGFVCEYPRKKEPGRKRR